MRKTLYTIFVLLSVMFAMMSCSESDGSSSSTEFDDWQSRNDAFFADIYRKAQENQNNSTEKWMIIRSFSRPQGTSITDNIVVKVIAEGEKNYELPLAKDTVRVHYRGRLIPSQNHPDGMVFDSSWSGDYNTLTMTARKFAVNGLTNGFQTAILSMRPKDRWLVYVPYSLGYGTETSGSIPGYSTLIFDITLKDIWRPGTPVPVDR
jgi:FKBP-type peptidyl-prolyl cis-trans isomerase FklB